MLVNGKHYRTVWFENGTVKLIDQTKLPFSFEIHECKNCKEVTDAIKNMVVRGAGAIGSAAGFGMALAFLESKDKGYLEKTRATLENTRPTAQNLFYAINRVFDAGAPEKAVEEAQKIADEDVDACKKIGEFGKELIKEKADGSGFNIETHCNAGWLAFTDWGTALSPIYAAKRGGKKIFVYVNETRPRNQGARLTAWELKNEGIDHAIIPDNAAGYYMQKGEIDVVIVGADRIARNGDTANKIGTLEKAIISKEFGVPFYVAAPLSTIDTNCKNGDDIPIEERSEEEVLYQTGIDEKGNMRKILVCSPNSKARNPAFDVTPAKFITGIITEKGIIKAKAEDLVKLFR